MGRNLIIEVAALALLVLAACGDTGGMTVETATPGLGAAADSSAREKVIVYLVALEDAGQRGQLIGCDDSLVPFEQETVSGTSSPEVALSTLLAMDERPAGSPELYNALAQSNLTLDEFVIQDGQAEIHLAGELRLGGVCDEPRISAQLEQTALQFDALKNTAIFVNGESLADQMR